MRNLSPKRPKPNPAAPHKTTTAAPAAKPPTNPAVPNANGLQEPTPTHPAGPPFSTLSPPASSPNSDTDVEMTEATSRSRTTEELSPGSSPARETRRQRVSNSPPATPLVLPQHYTSPPASPSLSATQPQDPELDLQSTLAPLEPVLSRQ